MEKKRAGYEYLLAYKITVPIYDYTVEFCRRCQGSPGSKGSKVTFPQLSSMRTYDQMVQASRSGNSNIPEGNQQASLAGYIKLTGVNIGSLEELLKDYLSYARQNRIPVWGKERTVREVREVGGVWEILKKTPTLPDFPNFPDIPDNPAQAVNLMITLVNQAIYLQKKLSASLEKKFVEEGGFRENLFRKRRDFKESKGGWGGKGGWSNSALWFVIVFSVLIGCIFVGRAEAQVTKPSGGFNTTVSAAVGEFYLNVSGYISPYASVVLTSGGKFYRSTVADSNGNFYISSILINRGFSNFCLTSIDFKRMGESITCFYFPPAKNSITMTDLFLPPTLGLSRVEVAAGSTVMAFGYTMPNATVTLNINNIKYTVTANGQGYYQFPIKDLKAGTYQLFAGAKHNGKDSLRPSKYLKLKALSLWEQFLAFIRDIWERVRRFVTSVGLGPLWFGIPILILIIILILKLWPERFTFVYESRLVKFFSDLRHRGKKMHHEWFVGY